MLDWCEDVELLSSEYITDDYGNQRPNPVSVTVQASRKELAMSEFYAAAQAGIRPAVELIVHMFEYNGQQNIKWRGDEYTVIRIYQRNNDEVELYLERKISDGNKHD